MKPSLAVTALIALLAAAGCSSNDFADGTITKANDKPKGTKHVEHDDDDDDSATAPVKITPAKGVRDPAAIAALKTANLKNGFVAGGKIYVPVGTTLAVPDAAGGCKSADAAIAACAADARSVTGVKPGEIHVTVEAAAAGTSAAGTSAAGTSAAAALADAPVKDVTVIVYDPANPPAEVTTAAQEAAAAAPTTAPAVTTDGEIIPTTTAAVPPTTTLPPPVAPPAVLTGAGKDGGPRVRRFTGGAESANFFAYDQAFKGGVTVALGDVDGDGIPDLITAPGVGGGPHIRVLSGATQQEIWSFFAVEESWTGGLYVASGDFNGDGYSDIVVGAMAGGAPRVQVWDGKTRQAGASFFPYDQTFTGGVRVAAADVDGDGLADIVTGAGPGGAPHVKVFKSGTSQEIRSFFGLEQSWTGGIFVAAGDVNGDGFADIVVGADAGGGPHVQFWDGKTQGAGWSFFPFAQTFAGGVRVAIGDYDANGSLDLLVAAGPGGGPHVKVYDIGSGNEFASFFAYEETFTGGVYVAAAPKH